VAAAAQRGGFVLLTGGSSVGKTRCAFEAVKDLLPEWWLVHPAGPGEVAALARAPAPQTVVWLDELQDYLDGEHGLTAAVVRALLSPPHPAVILGTMLPEWYAGYGLTQTLAAAPQLVARWEDAQAAAPSAWAVLTAALDATGLGARAPLSAEFLRAAAPGYCTSR
jgi:hypothetical protein